MIENFVLSLVYVANFSNILIILAFFFYFSHTRNNKYALAVLGYSIYALAFFIFYINSPQIEGKYIDFYNFLGEVIGFSIIIYFCLRSPLLRKITIAAGIAVVIFFIIYLNVARIKPFDPVLNTVRSISLFVLTLLVFYEKFQTVADKEIYNDYKFWGILGLIIFVSGTFLFYLVYFDYYEEVKNLEIISLALYLIKTILFLISLVILGKSKTKESKPPSTNIPFLDLE